jgi:hypothetical protein
MSDQPLDAEVNSVRNVQLESGFECKFVYGGSHFTLRVTPWLQLAPAELVL